MDYTKILVVKHSDLGQQIILERNQFHAIISKKHQIAKEIRRYIKYYKDILKRNKDPNSIRTFRYSTLKYFHKELGIENNKELNNAKESKVFKKDNRLEL